METSILPSISSFLLNVAQYSKKMAQVFFICNILPGKLVLPLQLPSHASAVPSGQATVQNKM